MRGRECARRIDFGGKSSALSTLYIPSCFSSDSRGGHHHQGLIRSPGKPAPRCRPPAAAALLLLGTVFLLSRRISRGPAAWGKEQSLAATAAQDLLKATTARERRAAAAATRKGGAAGQKKPSTPAARMGNGGATEGSVWSWSLRICWIFGEPSIFCKCELSSFFFFFFCNHVRSYEQVGTGSSAVL